jgi:hypothetical protein
MVQPAPFISAAMTTQAADLRIATALRRRIQQFYDHLNRREWERCFQTIDPSLRQVPSSVTLAQYASSLERFLERCGIVKLRQIDPIHLHLNEPNRLYNNRAFAQVEVVWEDQSGQRHVMSERWVRDRRGRWYTRCTGLVAPEES